MSEAQGEFDRRATPLCPDELTAPVLHKVSVLQVFGKVRSRHLALKNFYRKLPFDASRGCLAKKSCT